MERGNSGRKKIKKSADIFGGEEKMSTFAPRFPQRFVDVL
jgi:hypothetical protein